MNYNQIIAITNKYNCTYNKHKVAKIMKCFILIEQKHISSENRRIHNWSYLLYAPVRKKHYLKGYVAKLCFINT